MSNQRFSLVALAAGLLVVVLLFIHAEAGTIQKRAIIEEPKHPEPPKPKVNYCHRSTPCRWEVYVPFIRETRHFLNNTCVCPPGLKCMRAEDDYSVSAYVHRCRNITNTEPRILSSDYILNNSP